MLGATSRESLTIKDGAIAGKAGAEDATAARAPTNPLWRLLATKEQQDRPAATGAIEAMRGGGQPLPESARTFFEPRFGHDFSRVRVHIGAQAEGVARQLGARAYTAGTDVGFGRGQYAPAQLEGRRLLAHELAHVVQQRNGARPRLQLVRLLDFNDNDVLHDPSKLTDAQIETTDEFKSYMNGDLVWQWGENMTKDESLLACRLMLRHLREGQTIVFRGSGARDFMNLARKQLGTLKKSEASVGSLEWTEFSHKQAVSDPSQLKSDFTKWILAGGPEPDAKTGKANCFEMVLLSAYQGGFTSKQRIVDIYHTGLPLWEKSKGSVGVGDILEANLRAGKEYLLDLSCTAKGCETNPNSPEPLPGDIVIFGRAKFHLAISRGIKENDQHKIISLWARDPKHTKVEDTTIEELLPDAKKAAKGENITIKFWSPKW